MEVTLRRILVLRDREKEDQENFNSFKTSFEDAFWCYLKQWYQNGVILSVHLLL